MRDPNEYGRHLREVVERHQSMPEREQRSQIRRSNSNNDQLRTTQDSQRKERR